jgi:hypothetical protein
MSIICFLIAMIGAGYPPSSTSNTDRAPAQVAPIATLQDIVRMLREHRPNQQKIEQTRTLFNTLPP